MLAAIDTNGLYTTKAGIARYIRGLLRGLKSIPEAPTFFEFAWEVENFDYRQPMRSLKTAYRELFWGPFLANGKLSRAKADLVHTTGNALYRPRIPHVATLHDLALLTHPERYRTWQVAAARHRFEMIAAADQIICISQFTADEAVRLLQIPAAKITVVHNGIDFRPGQKYPETPPSSPVPPEFFLFVGSLEPGKNLTLLKQTYQQAAEKNLTLPPLMIVGARWEGVPGEGTPPPNWHYLGHQTDEVLIYLYRRAIALLFPSKYEGFGLPVGEAQALGCPVICSRVASLPEVGGDAALYAEQTPSGYLEAVQLVSKDSSKREEMIARGLRQATHFSWERCARETVAVYHAAVP